LQVDDGYEAVGVPQDEVSSVVPELRFAGTFAVFQNQMKTPEMSNCVAQTPPPADANALPTLFRLLSATTQPALAEQSVAPFVPLWVVLAAFVHPVLV